MLFLFKFNQKKLHLSGHYILSIIFEAFFYKKNLPHPPKVKWSNIEYSIKLRDKNKESSMYAQNS